MVLFLNILLFVLAAGVAVPIAVLCVECFAALARAGRSEDGSRRVRPSVAVLVPAHNEELVIEATIKSLICQLREDDRIVVVADNCSDETAAVACQAGAEVIERNDADRVGKGCALAHGIDHLREEPPEVLVLMDADTVPDTGAIEGLAREAGFTGRPVQGVYLLEPPRSPSPRDLISCFAFTVKNLVRPLGLSRLGLPCPLTGSGMALPWPVAAGASLDNDNIVEDMQLGVDLAVAGYAPRLCPEARVRGRLPQRERAATSQRRRWEHGHIQTLLKQTPRLLVEAVKQRRLELLAMAVDLAVPPLSLLSAIWGAATGLAVFAAVLGASWGPALVLGVGGAMLAASVLVAWAGHGRQIVPLRTMLAVPFYVAWKIPLYLAFAFRRQKTWVRTERDQGSGTSAPETSR